MSDQGIDVLAHSPCIVRCGSILLDMLRPHSVKLATSPQITELSKRCRLREICFGRTVLHRCPSRHDASRHEQCSIWQGFLHQRVLGGGDDLVLPAPAEGRPAGALTRNATVGAARRTAAERNRATAKQANAVIQRAIGARLLALTGVDVVVPPTSLVVGLPACLLAAPGLRSPKQTRAP